MTPNLLIIKILGVILSFEIFLKSQLTNVKGILLRVTPLGRVFKIHDIFGMVLHPIIALKGAPAHSPGQAKRHPGSKHVRQ